MWTALLGAALLTQAAFASAVDTTPDGLRNVAAMVAVAYRIDPIEFAAIAECESGFVADAKSQYIWRGKPERSYGVFQIHLDSHPEVTYAQAINPLYNIVWAAQRWDDAPHQWYNCYKKYEKERKNNAAS